MYDVIIIGAGPAGLAAGVYAGRALLKTLIIEKGVDGGQIFNTAEIENYPGQLLEGESGPSLIERMSAQVERFGVERVSATVSDLELEGDVKRVICGDDVYEAHSVIVATGAHPRPIGCKDEKKFVGQGISFCATCDGAFFRGLEVYVVGGGDAAVEEAIFLTRFARKVTIIHRRDELRAAKSIQEKAFANEKIAFLWDSVVEEVAGSMGVLDTIVVRNVKTDELTTIKADAADGMLGLFGFIGYLPNTELLQGKLELDEAGYVIADENTRTSVPGVFAAGDLRVKSLRQVVTAVADGAIAATQAEKYLG